MIYKNWDMIGTEPSQSTKHSFGDVFSLDILYDMKQELIPLLIAGPLFIAAKMYNNHLDRLEEEYLE